MRDILKNIPKRRCKYGGIAMLVAAGLCGGAAICFARSPQPALAVVWITLAMFDVIASVLLLKKGLQP
jgi:uncharacterized membrane protein AbrB (regulator of aidB expression)